MDATINVAKDFPETVFINITGYKTAENVGTGFGKQEEPRYVCGMLSGAMTKSNMIGYVASFPIPEVIRNINAFTLGAQAVNPNVTVRVVWTNTWYDPQKERAAAEALLDGGADVLSQHQDSPAAMQAAEARGGYGCGNDLDMAPLAPKAVLSTPIWHWDVFYTETVEQVRNGTWESGQYWGGWKDGIVDLAPIAEFVPAEVKAAAEAEAAKFKSGEKSLSTIFTGPIKDQSGAERIPAGTTMSDEDLLAMNWFVAGIEGEIPT
jgi:basic membrane protein A